jgi:hypothetical protein
MCACVFVCRPICINPLSVTGYLAHSFSPWNRVFWDGDGPSAGLEISRLVRIITVSNPEPNEKPTHLDPVSFRFILMSSIHIRFRIPCDLFFSSAFPTKFLHSFHIYGLKLLKLEEKKLLATSDFIRRLKCLCWTCLHFSLFYLGYYCCDSLELRGRYKVLESVATSFKNGEAEPCYLQLLGRRICLAT